MWPDSKKTLGIPCVVTTLTTHTFVCLASPMGLPVVNEQWSRRSWDFGLERPLACCWAREAPCKGFVQGTGWRQASEVTSVSQDMLREASPNKYLQVTDASGSAGGNLSTHRTRTFESKRDEEELLIRKIDRHAHAPPHTCAFVFLAPYKL